MPVKTSFLNKKIEIDKPVYVDNIIEREIHVPKEKIIEIPREKLVEKKIPYYIDRKVPVERIIEHEIEVPI